MKKISLFLVIILGFTALIAGYLMVNGGLDANLKTGTILDKFSKEEQVKGSEKNKLTPTLLTTEKVISPVLSSDKTSILYYAKDTGKLMELNIKDRTEKAVLDTYLPGFISAVWSPTKKDVVSYFNLPAGNFYKYYNLENLKTVELDRNIRSVAFSPDGNLLAYYYLNEGATEFGPVGKIVMSQPDGSYPKKVIDTRLEDARLTWPSKDSLAIKTSIGIFTLTQDGKLTKIIESGPSLEEKWSLSGTKLLFSVFSNDTDNPGVMLWLKEVSSDTPKPLELAGTAYLCAWSIDDVNVFCAVTNSSSTDDIYKIDTQKGSSKLIAETWMPIREVLLSPLEDKLFFINDSDEKLYSIDISQ